MLPGLMPVSAGLLEKLPPPPPPALACPPACRPAAPSPEVQVGAAPAEAAAQSRCLRLRRRDALVGRDGLAVRIGDRGLRLQVLLVEDVGPVAVRLDRRFELLRLRGLGGEIALRR